MSVVSLFRYNYRSSGLSSQYIESYVKLTNAYSRDFAHFPYKRTSSATIRRSAMGPEYPPQSLPQSPRFTRAGPFGADPSRTIRRKRPILNSMPTTLHRFKSGKYEGKTVEEVFLRDAPHLYRLKAAQKTGPIVDAIDRLRDRLRRSKIIVRCGECGKRACRMTFPVESGTYWNEPYWCCDRDEPPEKRGISGKMPIHFDAIRHFTGKKYQAAAHKEIREAFVKKGVRINEEFGLKFFWGTQ